jgi:acyl-CoA thioester hydrolase
MKKLKKNGCRIKVNNELTVRFHEVDSYNIVHNVHYFNYFDIGRFHLVDKFLRRERPDEISEYIYLVLTADCKYVDHARLDDELTVETMFEYPWEQKNARLKFSHAIFKKKRHVEVARGTTVLGICDREYNLQYRFPDRVKKYLRDQIGCYMNTPDPNVQVREIRI